MWQSTNTHKPQRGVTLVHKNWTSRQPRRSSNNREMAAHFTDNRLQFWWTDLRPINTSAQCQSSTELIALTFQVCLVKLGPEHGTRRIGTYDLYGPHRRTKWDTPESSANRNTATLARVQCQARPDHTPTANHSCHKQGQSAILEWCLLVFLTINKMPGHVRRLFVIHYLDTWYIM